VSAERRVKTRARRSRSAGSRFVSDEVPLYYQLAGVLRDRILSGHFGTGDRLPTEAELVSEYRVSRITVRQALQMLERSQLIRREVGRGTFVTDHRPFTGTQRFEGSLDDLITIAASTTVRLIDLRTVRATPDEAAMMGLAAGVTLTRGTRLRFHAKEPYAHVVVDVPAEFGRKLTPSDWKGTVARAMENKLKVHLRDAVQVVRASLADAALAQALDTPIGAPLLSVDRRVMGDDGRVVERVRTHYRADVFSFTMHLSRDRAQSQWAIKGRPKG
jgi:GntR family transcriptional regulator